MDYRTLLVKIVILIYRCKQLSITAHNDLIKTTLDSIRTDNRDLNIVGGGVVDKLRDYCYTLLEDQEPLLKETLIPSLTVILESDVKGTLLNAIKESVEAEQEEGTIKRVIASHVKFLNNSYRERLAMDIISKTHYDMKFNRNKIGNFANYLKEQISKLEPLSEAVTSIKDPAVIGEIDFENPESMDVVIEEMKVNSDDSKIYRTGWQGLNNMFSGGFRTTDNMINLGALQHNYKSSMLNSLFAQLAYYNKPIMSEEDIAKGLKPLILKISLEDSLVNNCIFIYQYLKATEGELIDLRKIKDIDTKEISEYINDRLTANGWHIKMLRVDPSQADASWLSNVYLNLEAQGYKVLIGVLDYIGIMSTRGCVQGSIGDDRRDLLKRVRNIAAGAGGSMITALQLSPAAKQLLRNGVPDHQLLKEIYSKGYYQGTSGADQEFDIGFLLKLCERNGMTYLNIHWDKHRNPVLADPKDFNIYIPFENGRKSPLMPDLDRDPIHVRALPRGGTGEGAAGTSLIDEVLL